MNSKPELQYPYQNIIQAKLPGEKWKDIVGFESYYQVSNLGRIRSLDRVIPHRRWGTARLKGTVISPRVSSKKVKTTGEVVHALNVSLHLEGQIYNFAVNRLVYNAFIKRIDLKDRHLYIISKDGDGRNICAGNLALSTPVKVITEAYKKGHIPSPFADLAKNITQFDIRGNPIACYKSITEAAKMNRCTLGGISRAIITGGIYKGYLWKEGGHRQGVKNQLLKVRQGDEVNYILRQQLDSKEISYPDDMPLLNLSLKNIRGERWMPLTGYKGRYSMSNYGRLKRHQKISDGIKKMLLAEHIVKIKVRFRRRPDKAYKVDAVCYNISKDGVEQTIYPGRWIYFLFVEKSRIRNPSRKVIFKDNNPLNLRIGNLKLQ